MKYVKFAIGKKFGKWEVVGVPFWPKAKPDQIRLTLRVPCVCECGKTQNVMATHLSDGRALGCKSCRFTGHGESGTRIHRIWLNMRQRCRNTSNPNYIYYGGRGIKICKEWDDYATFAEWARESGYDDNLTIDRIDNDGDYEPDNCKWITIEKQQSNKRRHGAKYITAFGETKTLKEWSEDERCNVPYSALASRVWYKSCEMSPEDILTIPLLKKKVNELQITAFGKTKTIREWSKDKRCVVPYDTLKKRMQRNYMKSPEDAITKPLRKKRR